MIEYSTATIAELSKAIKEKKVSSLDLVKEAKKIISKEDKDINAFVEVFDDIEQQAKDADKAIASGNITPLTGIPVAIKDNICIKDKSVTAGSKILDGFVSSYDSTVVEKLRKYGAVFIGRVNCDEFAMGGSTETSHYGVTKNPNDVSRVSGGSSGGSAAAVKSGAVPYALASDTGGSIRQPSSFCGCVGLKPTYGSVSRNGLIALASSLDCIGPITRSIEDTQTIFNIIKGGDNYDPTFGLYKDAEVKDAKKKIGIPMSLVNRANKTTVSAIKTALEGLEQKGYEVIDIKLPLAEIAPAIYYIIQPAEASSNLARFDGIKYGYSKDIGGLWENYLATRGAGFGDEVTRRIIIGNYVLSAGYIDAYYRNAVAVRDALTKEIYNAMKGLDAIAMPTTLGEAFKIGEHSDPVSMYSEDIFTVQANLTGMPAISVPLETDGLPLGIQFISNYGNEEVLFSIGNAVLNNN